MFILDRKFTDMKRFTFKNPVVEPVIAKSLFVLLFLFAGLSASVWAQTPETGNYIEYKGKVVNAQTKEALPGVHLSVSGAEIASITNQHGVFSLKVPLDLKESVIKFTRVGFLPSNIQLKFFDEDLTEVSLQPSSEKLREVEIFSSDDPRKLVMNALKKRSFSKDVLTGFYREKIYRGSSRLAMLAEAVVQVDEDKWASGTKGEIKLYKSRKSTNYQRLDTVAVKLRGGPYTTFSLDLIKFPEYLFYKYKLEEFNFSFDEATTINNRFVFTVYFEQTDKNLPWYYGRLYIDGKTGSLVKAQYSLNVDNRTVARQLLVVQKPKDFEVTPLETSYEVDYLLKDGEWKYSYSHFYIKLSVNRKGQLFNKRYTVDSEMVITDRNSDYTFPQEGMVRVRPGFIMADDVSGFADPDFWGTTNIIEPDKSLKDAIETIRNKIEHP